MSQIPASLSVRLKRAAFTILGSLFLALGALGIVVPFLPTTPFLLLSAACYLKGSSRMHKWLLTNRIFGAYIKNYKEGRGMTARAKIFTIVFLWATIVPSVLFLMTNAFVQVILVAICVGVTAHLLRIRTCRQVTLGIDQAKALADPQPDPLREASKHS